MIDRRVWAPRLLPILLGLALAAIPAAAQPGPAWDANRPVTLTDGDGSSWDIHSSGEVGRGHAGRTFSTAFRTTVNGSNLSSLISRAAYMARRQGRSLHQRLGTRGVAIGPVDLGSTLRVRLRVERLPGGWIRFCAAFENPGRSPVAVRVERYHGFSTSGTEAKPVRSASGGSLGAQAYLFSRPGSAARSLLLITALTEAKYAVQVTRSSSRGSRVVYPPFTLAPGRSTSLVCFARQLSDASAAARLVSAFPRGEALTGLPSALRLRCVNVQAGATLPGLAIVREQGRDLVILDDGRRLRGRLNATTLEIDGALGKLSVPMTSVWGILRGPRAGYLTVALAGGEIRVGRTSSAGLELTLPGGERAWSIPWQRLRSVAVRSDGKSSPPAAGPVLLLRSGDRLRVLELGGPLVVHSRLGRLELTLDDIRVVELVEQGNWGHRIVLRGGSRLGGLLADGELEATLADGKAHRFDRESIRTLTGTGGADASTPDLSLELTTGDRLVGRMVAKTLALDSEFGRIALPWTQLKKLEVAEDGLARVTLVADNLLRGHLGGPPVQMQLGRHTVRVPVDLIARATALVPRIASTKGGNPAQLVKALDAESFKLREKAQAALIAMGAEIRTYLQKRLAGKDLTAEQRSRIKQVLEALGR